LFVTPEQLAVLSVRRSFLLLKVKFGSATDKGETSPRLRFLFFLRWQRKSTPTRLENVARKKDPPRGSLHVFCRAFPWQMITNLFFRCHHDLLVQHA